MAVSLVLWFFAGDKAHAWWVLHSHADQGVGRLLASTIILWQFVHDWRWLASIPALDCTLQPTAGATKRKL